MQVCRCAVNHSYLLLDGQQGAFAHGDVGHQQRGTVVPKLWHEHHWQAVGQRDEPVIVGLPIGKQGLARLQRLPQGDAVAHALPLDELFACVAALSF